MSRIRTRLKQQGGPFLGFYGLNTQVVSLHINPSLIQVIDSKEFISSRRYGFAGVGLEGALKSNSGTRAGHIQAIVFRLVKGVGKLYKDGITDGCLRGCRWKTSRRGSSLRRRGRRRRQVSWYACGRW